jgi:uncharacterized protein (TIGR03067 family)
MIRRVLISGLAILAISVSSDARSDVVELEGAIKSVDAAKREITVGKKTLEVTKKCQITVNGEQAELSDLKTEQQVTVEYDDELDVAKSLTVGETGVGSDAMTKDLKALQGEWVATTLVISGKKLTKSEMQRHSRRFVFKGNSYREEVTRDGNTLVVEGKFEIDPGQKEIDVIGRTQFEGKEPNPGVHEIFGFYAIDGDKVRFVYRKKGTADPSRPTKFGEGDEGKAYTNSFILERDE